MKHAIRDIRRRALSTIDVVENLLRKRDIASSLAEIAHFREWLARHSEQNISVAYMNDEAKRGSNVRLE